MAKSLFTGTVAGPDVMTNAQIEAERVKNLKPASTKTFEAAAKETAKKPPKLAGPGTATVKKVKKTPVEKFSSDAKKGTKKLVSSVKTDLKAIQDAPKVAKAAEDAARATRTAQAIQAGKEAAAAAARKEAFIPTNIKAPSAAPASPWVAAAGETAPGWTSGSGLMGKAGRAIGSVAGKLATPAMVGGAILDAGQRVAMTPEERKAAAYSDYTEPLEFIKDANVMSWGPKAVDAAKDAYGNLTNPQEQPLPQKQPVGIYPIPKGEAVPGLPGSQIAKDAMGKPAQGPVVPQVDPVKAAIQANPQAAKDQAATVFNEKLNTGEITKVAAAEEIVKSDPRNRGLNPADYRAKVSDEIASMKSMNNSETADYVAYALIAAGLLASALDDTGATATMFGQAYTGEADRRQAIYDKALERADEQGQFEYTVDKDNRANDLAYDTLGAQYDRALMEQDRSDARAKERNDLSRENSIRSANARIASGSDGKPPKYPVPTGKALEASVKSYADALGIPEAEYGQLYGPVLMGMQEGLSPVDIQNMIIQNTYDAPQSGTFPWSDDTPGRSFTPLPQKAQ